MLLKAHMRHTLFLILRVMQAGSFISLRWCFNMCMRHLVVLLITQKFDLVTGSTEHKLHMFFDFVNTKLKTLLNLDIPFSSKFDPEIKEKPPIHVKIKHYITECKR